MGSLSFEDSSNRQPLLKDPTHSSGGKREGKKGKGKKEGKKGKGKKERAITGAKGPTSEPGGDSKPSSEGLLLPPGGLDWRILLSEYCFSVGGEEWLHIPQEAAALRIVDCPADSKLRKIRARLSHARV